MIQSFKSPVEPRATGFWNTVQGTRVILIAVVLKWQASSCNSKPIRIIILIIRIIPIILIVIIIIIIILTIIILTIIVIIKDPNNSLWEATRPRR